MKILTYLDIIIVIVDISLFPLSLSCCILICAVLIGGLSLFFGGDKVVYLDIALLDRLLLNTFLFLGSILLAILATLRLTFLLIRIFMIHTIVKILIVQLLIITIKFTDTWMESNHDIFVFHETRCHLDDFVSGFVAGLGVEWTEDDTSG